MLSVQQVSDVLLTLKQTFQKFNNFNKFLLQFDEKLLGLRVLQNIVCSIRSEGIVQRNNNHGESNTSEGADKPFLTVSSVNRNICVVPWNFWHCTLCMESKNFTWLNAQLSRYGGAKIAGKLKHFGVAEELVFTADSFPNAFSVFTLLKRFFLKFWNFNLKWNLF